MYVNTHFVVTTTFLVWLYLARNHAFYYVRNMFMLAMGLALVGYVVFPTAPPGSCPSGALPTRWRRSSASPPSRAPTCSTTPFAAVPSMHVAFALMIAVPAFFLVRRRVLKVLWGLYPILVTFVVVVTANHFWVDAALGALVAAVSACAASTALARARPEAWRWRTAAAKVPA